MNWEDLLQKEDERLVAPWFGGKYCQTATRHFRIKGRRPHQHGWYEWRVHARQVELVGPAEPQPEMYDRYVVTGYLVGDHLVPDDTTANFMLDASYIARTFERVRLLDDGIERFSRISAGRVWSGGELIYRSLEMPLGPEPEVLRAYYDREPSLDGIKDVTPALQAAFLAEMFQRAEAERIRAELERREREERERREREERRQQIIRQLGDGAGRREMARVDFLTAARAALAVGGAELLDWRHGQTRREFVVTYRVDDERLQCVVDETLHVIDAGVCLQDHATGYKGDQLFTLESLPAVIREAIRDDKLVKWRHV